MRSSSPPTNAHSHTFGQDARKAGERKTLLVIVLTAVMMVVEIVGGLAFGSMALLADGMHMASHTVALGIAAFAYWYARKHAADERFSFGTGKVNALGGYTGAILLAIFALMMAGESIERLFNPTNIAFNSAIAVAVLGLVVNGVSAVILGDHNGHDHGHHHHDSHEHDHNLRSAYLHVIADALTSLTAIGSWRIMLSMFIGMVLMAMAFNAFADMPEYSFLGLTWMDHMMMGGFMFALAFMATDPVTAAQTNTGKWIYGLLIGSIGLIVRVSNPAYPEGWMMAILLMNVVAPLIDHYVYQANIQSRAKGRLSNG